jgi:hypothetical protein
MTRYVLTSSVFKSCWEGFPNLGSELRACFGCECEGANSEGGGGLSQLHRSSRPFLDANKEAAEWTRDDTLSYGSDMSEELGTA